MKRAICFLFVFFCMTALIVPAVFAAEEETLSFTEAQYTIDENGIVHVGSLLCDDGSSAKPVKSGGRKAANIPSSWDSRTNNTTTPVKNQKDTGCCWAFSTMSNLESYAITNSMDTYANADYSEAQLAYYSWAAIENSSDINYGEGSSKDSFQIGGNWEIAANTLSNQTGVSKDTTYPLYKNGTLVTSSDFTYAGRKCSDAGLYLKDVVVFSGVNPTNQTEVKNWIMANGSCQVCTYFNTEYYKSIRPTYASYMSNYYCPVTSIDGQALGTNHSVTIIGWDDSYSASNFKYTPAGDGAWLIKDSWGTGAHESGCYWISYYDAMLQEFAGYTCRTSDAYTKTYSYNTAPELIRISLPSGCSTANVFKTATCATGEYEELDAVSFYTLQPNVTVEIKIAQFGSVGKNISKSFTALRTQTVTCTHAGFHTVDLTNPLDLPSNKNILIMLTMTSADGSDVGVPIECSSNGLGVTYTFSNYQSYITTSANATSLTDVRDVGNRSSGNIIYPFGNCYIKAHCTQYNRTTCNHNASIVSQTNSTCTVQGKINYKCSRCGLTWSEAKPLAEHTFDSVVTDPTCEHTGYTTHTCSVCGYSYTDDETPMVSHTYVLHYYPADCENSGRYENVCSVCGHIGPVLYIAPLMHDPGNEVVENVVAATCTTGGSYDSVFYCNRCGIEIYREQITTNPLGHSFTNYVSNNNATCTEDGTKTAVCDRCNATSTITDEGSALGHDIVHHDAFASTCIAHGWSAYDTCSRCSYSTYTELPLSDHSPASAVTENNVAPTCTEGGGYDNVVYCSVCGEEISREHITIGPNGHSFVNYVSDNNATCTSDGTKTAVCEHCGATDTITDEGSMLEHDYQFEGSVASNCVSYGHETYICSVCGHIKTVYLTELGGHAASKYIAKVPATCTKEGHTAYRVCADCGAHITEPSVIPALQHYPVYAATNAATCTCDGTGNKVCSRCGVVLEENVTIPASGHKYSKWSDWSKEDISGNQSRTRKCEKCGHIETETKNEKNDLEIVRQENPFLYIILVIWEAIKKRLFG